MTNTNMILLVWLVSSVLIFIAAISLRPWLPSYSELDTLLVDTTNELDQDVTRSLKIPPVKLLYGVGDLLAEDKLMWIELEGYRCNLSDLIIVETTEADADTRTASLTFQNCKRR